MRDGVWLGLKREEPYDLVSTGDFTNPIADTFIITGEGGRIEKVKELFIIIKNVFVRTIIIRKINTGINVDIQFSKDLVNWYNELIFPDEINAENKTIILPFYVKFSVLNDIGIYPPSQLVNINDIKLELIVS